MSALQRFWPEDRIAWLGRIKVRARKAGHVVTVANRGERNNPMFLMTLRRKADQEHVASVFDIGELDHAVTQIETAGGANVR